MPRSSRPTEDAAHARPGEWRAIGRLLPYLTRFPARVGFALTLLIGAKVANVTLPLVLKGIVDALDPQETAAIVLPLGLLLAYGALRFATVAFAEIRDLVFGRVTEHAMQGVALDVFKHLHSLDLEFHLARRTGGLSRDIERGVGGIRFLLRFMLFNIVPTLIEIGMIAVILLVGYSWSFTAVILVSVAAFIAWSVIVTEWRTSFVRKQNSLSSRANTRAVDSLLNFETVKYFGNEHYEADEYDRNLSTWRDAMAQNRGSLALLNAGQAIIVAGAVTLMMILAAKQVTAGRMSLGDLVAVNAYMIQLFVPLNFLGFVYREIKQSLADMGRMFRLTDQKATVTDAPDAGEAAAGAVPVEFSGVAFGYDARRPILTDVNFEIPAGKKLAVVGASGAGKSTLGRLLFRFYDVDGGQITVGGRDVRAPTQQSLRANIGVVPQDTVLFNDTIGYNLAYGRPGATQDEIDAVVKMAHLADFIARLPDGYDTLVGERGLKLSGGEKQRIAIARALLKEPGILIFDEATSSLDSESERAVLGALKEAAAERTTLVIAHRLSTIIDADQIVVLEAGKVVERGTHRALLRADGRYAELWSMQQENSSRGDRLE